MDLKNNLVIINGEVMDLEIIAVSARNDKNPCHNVFVFTNFKVI